MAFNTMKNRSIYIAIPVIILSMAVIVVLNLPRNIPAKNLVQNNTKENEVALPEVHFDGEAYIPGTDIVYKYPKEGFYDLGLNITNETANGSLIASAHLEPTVAFDRNAQSAYVIAEIRLLKNDQNAESVKSLASSYKEDSTLSEYNRSYAIENGRILDIGGNEFFLYKASEDATAWDAFTIAKEGILEVTLSYTNSFTPYSEAVYRNNDDLFIEILKNIQLD